MTELLTQHDLDSMRLRAEAATPGPWDRDIARYAIVTNNRTIAVVGQVQPDGTMYATAQHDRDAAFICAAREDVLRLVAEVARLRAENNELRQQLEFG